MIEEKYKELAESAVSMVAGIQRTGIKIAALKYGYVKCVMPLSGNTNHVGIMYAGSLFTLGEIIGGIMWGVMFDTERFYPIVKEINIQFKRPATTDVFLEKHFDEDAARRIQEAAEKEQKADYAMELELMDAGGQVVCLVKGVWQIRKITEEMKGKLKF